MICLWDLTEEVLKKSSAGFRKREGGTMSHSNSVTSKDSGLATTDTSSSNHSSGASSSGSTDTGKASSTSSLTHKLASLGLGSKERDREHKRTFSLPGRGGHNKDKSKESSGARSKDNKANKDTTSTNSESGDSGLGWAGCPRLNETPMLEPVVMKKIAHERLTSLVFKESCLVTACQDGYVCTWSRPGLQTRCSDLGTENANNHYNVTPPPPTNQVGGGGGTGTVV